MDILDKFLDDLEKTFAHIRERECGDSVCGLCEYDGAYIGESGDWCNECPGFNKDDCFKLSDEIRKKWKAQLSQEDTISRQAAIDALMEILDRPNHAEFLYTDEIYKALSTLPSAQPQDIARDIATIIENEKDMRVIAKNAQPQSEKYENDTISRAEAIDAVRKNTFRLTFAEQKGYAGHVQWSAEAVYSDAMEGALLELLSAQSNIVRCKDCKHWLDIDDGRQKHRMCADVYGDWFCADAERRADD